MTNEEAVEHLKIWGRWCRTGELAPWLWESDEEIPFKLDRYDIEKAWAVQRAVMQMKPLELRLVLQVHYVCYKNMETPELWQEVNLRLWRAGERGRQISKRQYEYMRLAAIQSLIRHLSKDPS